MKNFRIYFFLKVAVKLNGMSAFLSYTLHKFERILKNICCVYGYKNWAREIESATKKKSERFRSVLIARLVCKPSSVLNGHLSRYTVACILKRFVRTDGQPIVLNSLASGGVYTTSCHQVVGELLPRLFTLTLAGGFFLLHFP